MKRRHLFLALVMALALFSMTACDSDGECHHDFKKWKITQEGDCKNPGIQSRECRDCGYTQTEQIQVSATHQEEIIPAVEATCTQSGATEGKRCSVCGEELEAPRAVEATGHEYVEECLQEAGCWGDGLLEYACLRCDHSYQETVTAPSYSAVQIHAMTEASVGEVTVYDANGNAFGLGSCFVYSADGKIVTNYHVIEGAYYADVTLQDTTYQVTKVLGYSRQYDLAILQIDGRDLQSLAVCTQSHPVGETVYAFGSSQGLTATFSQGIITHADRDLDGVHCVQHDAAISPGNSGGPLLNRFGEVIGINTWFLSDSQNLNFAVSIQELYKLDCSNPMTLQQVYEAERNVYTILQDYILGYGDFYGEANEYSVVMEAVVSSNGSEYITYYNYDLTYEELELCITVDWDMYLYFYVDLHSGVYAWEYVDVYGDYMFGYLDPADFAEGSMLPYEEYELNDSDTAADLCDWASYLAEILCGWIDYDWADLGITAKDLGFTHF